MSLKDDVNFVTKELSGDEKVLESAFKLETLYKKHKIKIWGVVISLVLFFVITAATDSIAESKLVKANEAFMLLSKDSNNSEALKVLQENNPNLFELYSYSQAVKSSDTKILEKLSSSKNDIISDASRYAKANLENKTVETKLYKDMSLYEEAYLAMKSGNKKEAREKLELIEPNSPISILSGLLNHSLVKAD